jgi:hypothetical protein
MKRLRAAPSQKRDYERTLFGSGRCFEFRKHGPAHQLFRFNNIRA